MLRIKQEIPYTVPLIKNIQLSNGGLAVDFDPAYTDEKVTIEFDMYMGSLKDKSTSYTIDSADGNILTVFVNEYSTSSSYISVEGAQIFGRRNMAVYK